MLKAICIDLFPCIIDKKKMFNALWKHVLDDQYDLYVENETINPFLYEDLLESENQNRFLSYLDNNDTAKSVCAKYEKEKKSFIKKYFDEFKFSDVIKEFFESANVVDCTIIIVVNDSEYIKLAQTINLKPFKNVKLSTNYNDINYMNLEEVFESNDIALNEFIYLTSDDLVVNQMKEKGLFYVKICNNVESEQEIDDKNLLKSIDDLSFDNISFNFYDNNDERGI